MRKRVKVGVVAVSACATTLMKRRPLPSSALLWFRQLLLHLASFRSEENASNLSVCHALDDLGGKASVSSV